MSAQPALLLLLVIGQIQFWLIPVIAWILLKGQRDTAAGFWFAGTACYACAATLFGLQMQVANLDLRVPAFALMSLMVLLFAESLRRELSNRPTPWLPIVAIPLLHAALMTWLDRIGGNDALMLGQLAVMTVLDVGCATLLVAVAWRRRSRALLIVLVGFLAAIPTNLLRIYAYLAHGESPALLTFTTRSNLGFVVNYLSVVVYSFGYWGFVIEKSRAALSRESSERERAQAEESLALEREQSTLGLLRERDELIGQLAHMQRAAQAGALSASIAHEINQPLATVRLSVEQALELSRVGAQTAQLDPLLERIASENGRAAAIIATLRDIFGNRNNQPETRSLDAVVSAMCELMRRRAREQGVALQVETDAPVRLRVGAGELEHVVLNLLTNALDALRRARVADGRIQVSTAVRDGRALLRVRDNGPGVDPDMRTKLFDLLVGSSRNGLGLGLWLSRHILDRSGGSIEIDADDPHPGASFTVSLHLADPDGAGARPSL